jgi:hypothetical protein
MATYRVTVVGSDAKWKRLKSDKILEYGDEVDVESESPEPGRIHARVTEVDNDAFFTNKVTVEHVNET